MTLLADDDLMTTGIEHAFGSLARTAPRRPAPLRAVPGTGGSPTPTPTGPRPRTRLVPAQPPGAAPSAEPPTTPAPLSSRVRVLRAADRSVVVGAGDEDPRPVPGTDAAELACRVGVGSVDAVLGRRPVNQLARWLAPGVLETVRVRAVIAARAPGPAATRAPRLRRARVCAVDEHAVEACLVVDDGTRVRAVAMRLESHRGAWQVTTLEIG